MAENKIRQGQLITPFGIGEMVDMPGDLSLIIAGTNVWDSVLDKASGDLGNYYDPSEFTITDEKRLADFLKVEYFISPPVYHAPKPKKKTKNANIQLPAYRFPQLHYCLKCYRIIKFELDRIGISEANGKTYARHQNSKGNDCNGNFIPFRFVAVCAKGHIQDIPVVEWVHGKEGCTGTPTLWYNAKGGADNLGGIKITCSTCRKTRSLAGITGEWALSAKPDSGTNDRNRVDIRCKGARPWLREAADQARGCGEPLHVLVKGASNTYFPSIASSLFIPSGEGEIHEYLENLFLRYEASLRESNTDNDGAGISSFVNALYTIHKAECDQKGITKELFSDFLKNRVNPRHEDQDLDESAAAEHYRYEEFVRLCRSRNNSSELKTKEIDINKYSFLQSLPAAKSLIEKIVLVEKLRETRALKGFTRYKPENAESSEARMELLSANPIRWLPANIVRGEGIFIKFNDVYLDQWSDKEDVLNHFKRMNEAYKKSWFGGDNKRPINPRFVAVHTLSHLLINKLCFNCGYGSSSLKERIYCSMMNDTEVMNGLLIYTASGDSEGSLGGLVKQGHPGYFDRIFLEALEDSKWCSADPVCSSVGIQNGQGPDNINGAACHNCSLVPETSCEEFNLLLDRTLLTGTLEDRELGLLANTSEGMG